MRCTTQPFTIGLLWVERNAVDESPVYQRESGIWSDEKQQLFIDSIFNDFDIPKIYFHDLRGKHGTKHYAVIDGKQRLHAIWRFLEGDLKTATDFSVTDSRGQSDSPRGAVSFPALSQSWQEIFKSKALDIVLISEAEEEDIEELFSRLNNGEPLTAAERRNAIGGDMADFVREIARMEFFRSYLSFSNKRYQFLEVAAKFVLVERSEQASGVAVCDLKKRFLDRLVEDNKAMDAVTRKDLRKRVLDNLSLMRSVFEQKDFLLSKQAYSPLYYIWLKIMNKEYAAPDLKTRLRRFLVSFQTKRTQNLHLPEEQRDPVLTEFGRLMQQGTNDVGSLQQRADILRRFFLIDNPDVVLRDRVRSFTEEERYAIWILGDKTCAECGKGLPDLADMEADHKLQWAHGGATTLENGRCLCKSCNSALATKVA